MTRKLLLLALLSIALVGARPIRMVQLTLVNKSGLEVHVRLTGSCDENVYYLRLPAGDRLLPAEKTFTIAPDTYTMQPYYIELWDPVYGYQCEGSKQQKLLLNHQTRVVIAECDRTPPNGGESSMLKFGGVNRRAGGPGGR